MMIDLPIRRGHEGPNRVSTSQFLRMRPLWLNYNGSEKLTNFQVKCTLTPSDIPFEKLRSDKQDLLFVDNNNEMIPYWIEKADSAEIVVWLKFPEIISGEQVFWLYYGNGNFSGLSDGRETFEFFDDFEDGDVSDWYNNDCGIFEARTDTAFRGSYSLFIDDPDDKCDERVYHDFSSSLTFDLILEGAVYISAWSVQIGTNPVDLWLNRNGDDMDTIDNIWAILPGSGCPAGQWREFKIAYLYSQQKMLVWRDWVEGLDGDPWSYTDSSIEGPATRIWVGIHKFGDGAGYFDLIRVRKYADPEPSIVV